MRILLFLVSLTLAVLSHADTVRYRVNGGAWVDLGNQVSPHQFQISDIDPYNRVEVRVENAAGFSAKQITLTSGIVRPYPPEQYLQDNFPSQWNAAGLQANAYQPYGEFVVYDSGAGETCEPSYPWDSALVSAGVNDCYDLRPPNWADVSCSGASGEHPSLSNVYIIRTQDANWAAADNAQYRWVLQCPGNYEQASKISISTSGVGPNSGEMRVYDCLDADGSYSPMRPFPLRTGTPNECSHGPIEIDGLYVMWRSTYSEGRTKEWTNAAFELDHNNSGQNVFRVVDNVDIYGGGQTAVGTGFKATYTVSMAQSRFVFFQNFRIVDCIARRNNDDIAIGLKGGGVSDSFVGNGEVTNCGHTVMIGEGVDGPSWASEGNNIENIWIPQDPNGARNMNQIDNRYWSGNYATGDRIPYGGVNGGMPPSYVQAAALTDTAVEAAFKCGADKWSSDCPFTCNENRMIGSKTGAMAANEPHLVRRVFSDLEYPSRRDLNNPIQDEPSPPAQRSATCGSSSGDDRNSGKPWVQNRSGGMVFDLIFGAGTAGPVQEVYSSGNTNKVSDVIVKNSIFVVEYPGFTNEYVDEHPSYIFNIGSGTTISGENEGYQSWGNTVAMQGFENAPQGSYPTRTWLGSRSGVQVDFNCSLIIDWPNADPDSTMNIDYIGLFGTAGDHNGITNRFPPSLTYSTNDLGPYVTVTHPWTSIGDGVLRTKTWPNLIPKTGSPLAGACGVTSP